MKKSIFIIFEVFIILLSLSIVSHAADKWEYTQTYGIIAFNQEGIKDIGFLDFMTKADELGN